MDDFLRSHSAMLVAKTTLTLRIGDLGLSSQVQKLGGEADYLERDLVHGQGDFGP